ncbi:aminotransferase class V-fold PLP-dependent enzyme [Virgibacillus sp. W0181]|uniref:aminotransferase class V-fold PLP-dependent enzyme n=1 Tax=Virgibacillus sp. W0181 TaxID=3391581 RepID=UPI003F4736EF
MIYFDQAASSFPKPDQVIQEMVENMKEYGANPGRGGHQLAIKADQIITETRLLASKLFGVTNSNKCLFYPNATIAINQALKGINWSKGDHIIATSVEHNAIRRPLEYLMDSYGVEVSFIKWTGNDKCFLDELTNSIKQSTKLVTMTHSSNVTGSVLPLSESMQIAKESDLWTLVDASQTAGHMPIHMKDLGISMLAFPGHKGLLGPQGTGMLLVEGDIDLIPIHHGGTGARSEDPRQPAVWPDRLESGTLNTPGIAGLHAALTLYEQRKSINVPRETILINRLVEGLKKIDGITYYGPLEGEERMPVAAFNVLNVSSQEIAMVLDSHYDIAVRGGLHCNPLEHQTIGTTKQGVIRASVGVYNTEEEVDIFLRAIKEIVTGYENL